MEKHEFIKELAKDLAEKLEFPFDPCGIYQIEKVLDEAFQKGLEAADAKRAVIKGD